MIVKLFALLAWNPCTPQSEFFNLLSQLSAICFLRCTRGARLFAAALFLLRRKLTNNLPKVFTVVTICCVFLLDLLYISTLARTEQAGMRTRNDCFM